MPRYLRRRGIDVTTTPEKGLIGISDEKQVEFALSERRVIFTQDTDFLRLHSAGISHYGIAYCSQGSKTMGEILQGLVLIWEISTWAKLFIHDDPCPVRVSALDNGKLIMPSYLLDSNEMIDHLEYL